MVISRIFKSWGEIRFCARGWWMEESIQLIYCTTYFFEHLSNFMHQMNNKLRIICLIIKCVQISLRNFFYNDYSWFTRRNGFISLQHNVTMEEMRPVWVVTFILHLIYSLILYWFFFFWVEIQISCANIPDWSMYTIYAQLQYL